MPRNWRKLFEVFLDRFSIVTVIWNYWNSFVVHESSHENSSIDRESDFKPFFFGGEIDYAFRWEKNDRNTYEQHLNMFPITSPFFTVLLSLCLACDAKWVWSFFFLHFISYDDEFWAQQTITTALAPASKKETISVIFLFLHSPRLAFFWVLVEISCFAPQLICWKIFS